MKNFIYISPHFPDHFFKFLKCLKKVGFNVLGIGDCPYESLNQSVKNNLYDYYCCSNMDNNFDELVNAVLYFKNKYGDIDALESNNEYWLYRDAKLRTIFNINGIKEDSIENYQRKSKMKNAFIKAGAKVAPFILVDEKNSLLDFIDRVGYPVYIKPDCGVGAKDNYKIQNILDLETFWSKKNEKILYICEKFVSGYIISYDGIADKNGDVVLHTSNIFPPSISDVLKEQEELFYYTNPDLVGNLAELGPKVIKAFDLRERFFHVEFFVLDKDIQDIGSKNDLVALEMNMRPAGGYTTDMINYSLSIDCYDIYAQVMMGNEIELNFKDCYYCACASRRDGVDYKRKEQDIFDRYDICHSGRYPSILSGIMGNKFYMFKTKNLNELETFKLFVSSRVDYIKKSSSNLLMGEDGLLFQDKSNEKYDDGIRICDKNIDGA